MKFVRDDHGSQFLENGIWIALVILALAGAGLSLAKTIDGKYTEMGEKIQIIEINKP